MALYKQTIPRGITAAGTVPDSHRIPFHHGGILPPDCSFRVQRYKEESERPRKKAKNSSGRPIQGRCTPFTSLRGCCARHGYWETTALRSYCGSTVGRNLLWEIYSSLANSCGSVFTKTGITLLLIPIFSRFIVWYWWCLTVNEFTSFAINANRRISCYGISKSKNNANAEKQAAHCWFFLFLLLESFDIRENMFWRWQEDGGRILPTRFLTMAKQST